MTLSIKNGGYLFLIRLGLMFSLSLWKEFLSLQILNDLSIKHLTFEVSIAVYVYIYTYICIYIYIHCSDY